MFIKVETPKGLELGDVSLASGEATYKVMWLGATTHAFYKKLPLGSSIIGGKEALEIALTKLLT